MTLFHFHLRQQFTSNGLSFSIAKYYSLRCWNTSHPSVNRHSSNGVCTIFRVCACVCVANRLSRLAHTNHCYWILLKRARYVSLLCCCCLLYKPFHRQTAILYVAIFYRGMNGLFIFHNAPNPTFYYSFRISAVSLFLLLLLLFHRMFSERPTTAHKISTKYWLCCTHSESQARGAAPRPNGNKIDSDLMLNMSSLAADYNGTVVQLNVCDFNFQNRHATRNGELGWRARLSHIHWIFKFGISNTNVTNVFKTILSKQLWAMLTGIMGHINARHTYTLTLNGIQCKCRASIASDVAVCLWNNR